MYLDVRIRRIMFGEVERERERETQVHRERRYMCWRKGRGNKGRNRVSIHGQGG